MESLIPGYLTPVILAGSVVNPAVVLFGLHRALRRSSLSEDERTRTFWTSALLLITWLVVALVTAVLGWYHPASKTPTVQYALLVPIVLGVMLFRRWGRLQRLLEIVPARSGLQACSSTARSVSFS